MAEPPGTKVIKSSEARQKFSELINQVFRTKTRVVVERSGIPVAAVIPAEDLERLQQFEEHRERAFSVIDEIGEAFEGVPEEEIEREVAKALAEVRQERRRALSHAP
ncbi:MAG: type II toxin-antitoxin system Phd/YefM family antitoxin [Chloroflexi bacterium]|nr:type II toxin-antitoxin system Phd/YefM family antitoxin [Chloroflexota bacterium]